MKMLLINLFDVKNGQTKNPDEDAGVLLVCYSTVTDLARLRGWSTSQPFTTAI